MDNIEKEVMDRIKKVIKDNREFSVDILKLQINNILDDNTKSNIKMEDDGCGK